jgi:tetratricopeptide (TPR) repeat protein/predicted Ser/Thr protein kinase
MPHKCPRCKTENPDTLKFCGECGTQLPSLSDVAVTETMETPKEELTSGMVFAGRYQIIDELGKGGMGRVYRVLDKKLNEEIALKLIKPEIAIDKKTVERFSNELKIARKIGHKNVARMFDLNEENGTHYITMEYVRGEDLKKLIRKMGQLSIGQATPIAAQICEGLREAHRLGVVHRDLKPQNVMVDEEGNARIMDFGIARSVETKGITGAGVMIGTPEYMSPEQVEGKEVDQRSDVYSLGVMLYEMLTGQVPFEGDTPFAIGVKHKSEKPKDPKELNAQIPDDLNRVILKCLEKEKESRYQSAGELQNDLTNIQKGIPATERIKPAKRPLTSKEITVTIGLKKLLVPALIILALVAIAVFVWQLFPQKEAFQAPVIENSVAVISFENLTGDQKYDYYRRSIPNLLITNLENAGFSYVVSWERMRDLLKQIGRGDLEIIDSEAGFEICHREGVEALVTGSLNKAGDMFAIELRILDVGTKSYIKTATSRGVGEQSIIETQIDELSREIARGIGIAQNKIEESKIHIADVTTDSIEAYNLYLEGEEQLYMIYLDEAQESLEKAIEIDPTFASAYRILAMVHNQALNPKAMDEALKKAKEFSERATEKERLFIEATYATYVEVDARKGLDILARLTEKYPKEKRAYFWMGIYNYTFRDSTDTAISAFEKALELDPDYGYAMNMIAYAHAQKEEYDKAIAYFEKYAISNPDEPNPLDSMAEVYFLMGRLDDAIAKYEETLKIKPDFGSDWMIAYIYALKEDYAETMKWIDRFISTIPSPGRKAGGDFWKGFYHYWLGNLDLCLEEFQIAADQATNIENEEMIARIEEIKGWIQYDRGDFQNSREHFENSVDIQTKQVPQFQRIYEAIHLIHLGFLDVKQGQIDLAKSKARKIEPTLPDVQPVIKESIKFLYDILQAEIALADGSVQQAIAIAEKLEGAEFLLLASRSDESIPYNMPFYKDVLARAFVENGELDKAIVAYEDLITFDPHKRGRYLIHPLYHYRLAKLYQEKGWAGKAIERFEKFLDIWKDADPDHPELEDARNRLAELTK